MPREGYASGAVGGPFCHGFFCVSNLALPMQHGSLLPTVVTKDRGDHKKAEAPHQCDLLITELLGLKQKQP